MANYWAEPSNLTVRPTVPASLSWAAIIAVPRCSSAYGQNVPYPDFNQASGFNASTLILVGLSRSLYWLRAMRRPSG
jgi:hypothetical protein